MVFLVLTETLSLTIVTVNLIGSLIFLLVSWKLKRYFADVAPFVLLIPLALALLYINDMTLVYIYNVGLSSIVPYGLLWFWTNPFWFTPHLYLWYLFAWESAFVSIMYFMYRRGKYSLENIYLYIVSCVFLTIEHGPQSITMISFIFLIPVFGLGSLIPAALTKLPVGWSWNLSDNHWKCAFGHSTYVIPDFLVPCNHLVGLNNFLQYPTLFYDWFNYGFLAFITIYNLNTWRNGRTLRKLCYDGLNTVRLTWTLPALLRAIGLYERNVKKVINQLVGDCAVDIGSNSGYYTKMLKPRFAHTFSFDPNPKWDAIHIALSDHEGESNFYIRSNAGSADGLLSTFRFRNANYEGGQIIRVPVRRFDSIFKTVDFVKIDVEGSEFQVLRGMSGSQVQKILVELHDENRDLELVALLSLMKFNVQKIDRNHWLGEHHT